MGGRRIRLQPIGHCFDEYDASIDREVITGAGRVRVSRAMEKALKTLESGEGEAEFKQGGKARRKTKDKEPPVQT